MTVRAKSSVASYCVKFTVIGWIHCWTLATKAGVPAHIFQATELTMHRPLNVRLVKAIRRKRILLQQCAWTERNVITQASQEAKIILRVPQQQFQKAAFNWKSVQLKQVGFLVTLAKDPAQDEMQMGPPRAVKSSPGPHSKLLLSLKHKQNMIFSPPRFISHQLSLLSLLNSKREKGSLTVWNKIPL